jgi:hypothetical protein
MRSFVGCKYSRLDNLETVRDNEWGESSDLDGRGFAIRNYLAGKAVYI